jgi:hypothetical protein
MERNRSIRTAVAACVLSLTLSAASPARTIYVGDDAPAGFRTIQAAIDDANDGDTIIIRPGTYTGPGNRDISFAGKAITVRSSDPDSPDAVAGTIVDCNGTDTLPHRGFYFHGGEDANSVLAGLTVTNGCADCGGGILCDKSSPSITGCRIIGNQTYRGGPSWGGGGAGICCLGGSCPRISQCEISGNVAHGLILATAELLHGRGGGLYSLDSRPVIIGCEITGNGASHGGGVYCQGASPVIRNSSITANTATDEGGGVACHHCDLQVENALVCGNVGWQWYGGGGIYCQASNPVVVNCTIAGNHHRRGGGVLSETNSNPVFRNCILWDNIISVYGEGGPCRRQVCPILVSSREGPSAAAFHYCDVQEDATGSHIEAGCRIDWGPGNIALAPAFAKPGYWSVHEDQPCLLYVDTWTAGDYHLQSQAGRWEPDGGSWVVDEVTSPCIDAGDPNSPVGDEPEPNGGRVNMGAYGGTGEASKSYTAP